jgi:hypothetical protein
MRVILAALALILSYAPTTSYAQDDPGAHSCGKYLAAVHGHAPGRGNVLKDRGERFYDDHILYMYWLGGFLSATNSWVTNDPNAIMTDGAAIDVWIRKWCEQNPTKPLVDAAIVFIIDQRKDYIKAWFARQAR